MADAYMTKPFNYDYLLATVKNLIRNRAILKEHFSSEVSHGAQPVSKNHDKKFLNDFGGIVEQNLANENLTWTIYAKLWAFPGCSFTAK